MLKQVGSIALPEHAGVGGFDHAAVHAATGHAYVAHTANNAVDVLDPDAGRHLFSIADLSGVAGVLVSDDRQLIITSNRAENTMAVFAPGPEPRVAKVAVGRRPNGLACDPARGLALVANVGEPTVPASHTLTMVELKQPRVLAEIPVPGRTRWAVYDPDDEVFYVNIADPPCIVVVQARDPNRIARTLHVPEAGPHGLDLDRSSHRLFCACDSKALLTLHAKSGEVLRREALSGVPDVVFFNPTLGQLYVGVGDPGVVEVFDTGTMARLSCIPTEHGAHTLAFDPVRQRVIAFLPGTHRAAVFEAA